MSGGNNSKNSHSQPHSRGSAGAKLVDESHMKTLRELSTLPGNRNCFECGQRAPNYVDVTIGSFICMTCSGLLRGITPPHRVKSISMATFTPEEIQLLKSRGNEYCRKVWLATYTARDSSLASTSSSTEQESDRRASLKGLMSAKYEQKRYWVDPSQIPELGEITLQNAKALSSASSSSTSGSNRSPSLSSASSGSSLSQGQHPCNGGGAPSPILNNLRNNCQLPLNPPNGTTHNRLVSSATMPDIKPLTTLFNGGGSGHGGIPPPFNFINNLSNGGGDDKIINTNPVTKDPWGNGDAAGNGFGADFANFDEAFSGGGPFSTPFSNNNGSHNNGNVTGKGSRDFGPGPGVGIGEGGFAIFDQQQQQQPLVPFSQNGSGPHKGGRDEGKNGHFGDRYAALKDLDELFKHGDTVVANNNTHPQQPTSNGSGLTSSTSMPANLSSSLGSGGGGWPIGNGNHAPPSAVPNPFSMFGTSPNTSSGNGWGPNPHNPFATTAPHPSVTPSWSPFGASPPGHGPNNQQTSQNSQLFQFGATPGKGGNSGVFNPFAASATTTAPINPHNPFL